jgi:hypothetical protein
MIIVVNIDHKFLLELEMNDKRQFLLCILFVLFYSSKAYSIVESEFIGDIIPCDIGDEPSASAKTCSSFIEESSKYSNIKVGQFACPTALSKIKPNEGTDLGNRQFISVVRKDQVHHNCDSLMNFMSQICPSKNLCDKYWKFMRPRQKQISNIIIPDVPKKNFRGFHHTARKQISSAYNNCLWYSPSVKGHVNSNKKICSKIKGTELTPFTSIFIENNKNLGGMLNQWSRDNYLEMIRAVGVNRVLERHFQLTGSPMEGINSSKCSQFQDGIDNILVTQKSASSKNISLLDSTGNSEHPTSIPYQIRIVAAAKKVQELITLRRDYNEKISKEITAIGLAGISESGPTPYMQKQYQDNKNLYERKIQDLENEIKAKMATYSFLTFDRDGSYWGDDNLWDKQPWIAKVAVMKPGSPELLGLMKSFVARTSSDLKDTLHRLCQVPGQENPDLSPITQAYKSKLATVTNWSGSPGLEIDLCIAALTESRVNTELVKFIKQRSKLYIREYNRDRNTQIDPNLRELLNSQCSPKDDAFSVSELTQMTEVKKEVLNAYPEYKALAQCLGEVAKDSDDFISDLGMTVGLACLGSAGIFPPFAFACGAVDMALMNHNHSLEFASTQKVIACRQAGDLCDDSMIQKSLDRLHSATTDLYLSIGGEVGGAVLSSGVKAVRLMNKSRKVFDNLANIEHELVYLSKSRRLTIENEMLLIKNSKESKSYKLKMIERLVDEVNDIRLTQKQLIEELGSKENAIAKFPCLF